MPSGEAYAQLKSIIDGLSSKYSTQAFEPHVTVIGGLKEPPEELLLKAGQVAALIRPHTIRLIDTGCLEEFYKCLFLRAASAELTRTHSEAKKIFGKPGESEYTPHLSLMYCDFQSDFKKKIIPDITGWVQEFKVDRLHLYSTEGDPPDWKPVQSFALNDFDPELKIDSP
jgi:2'-5' RNA ligase